MSKNLPRLVLVTRRSPLDLLMDRFGTRGQAEFYLKSRRESMANAQAIHDSLTHCLDAIGSVIPVSQRLVRVDRDALDRFLFAPDDVLIVVGQDGLVANVAKYLRGQILVGINPDATRYDGVLVPHAASQFASLLRYACGDSSDHWQIQERCLALAEREDGQQLRALNEIFVGHASHQSARYRLQVLDRSERQSSSGLIAATGTGATGWARSICQQRGIQAALPTPEQAALAWFVREPFPSIATQTSLDFGISEADQAIVVHSEMDLGGAIFADGIEADFLEFISGQQVRIGIAPERLRLLVAASG